MSNGQPSAFDGGNLDLATAYKRQPVLNLDTLNLDTLNLATAYKPPPEFNLDTLNTLNLATAYKPPPELNLDTLNTLNLATAYKPPPELNLDTLNTLNLATAYKPPPELNLNTLNLATAYKPPPELNLDTLNLATAYKRRRVDPSVLQPGYGTDLTSTLGPQSTIPSRLKTRPATGWLALVPERFRTSLNAALQDFRASAARHWLKWAACALLVALFTSPHVPVSVAMLGLTGLHIASCVTRDRTWMFLAPVNILSAFVLASAANISLSSPITIAPESELPSFLASEWFFVASLLALLGSLTFAILATAEDAT